MEKKKPKRQTLSPFDFIKSINAGSQGQDLLATSNASEESLPDPDSPEKAYTPFMINRGLSYFQDTILFANEMNQHSHLPAKMQYDFLRHGIRSRKRFSKWFKKIPDNDDIKIIMKHYGYSSEKAHEVYSLFSRKALETLHTLYNQGGK